MWPRMADTELWVKGSGGTWDLPGLANWIVMKNVVIKIIDALKTQNYVHL